MSEHLLERRTIPFGSICWCCISLVERFLSISVRSWRSDHAWDCMRRNALTFATMALLEEGVECPCLLDHGDLLNLLQAFANNVITILLTKLGNVLNQALTTTPCFAMQCIQQSLHKPLLLFCEVSGLALSISHLLPGWHMPCEKNSSPVLLHQPWICAGAMRHSALVHDHHIIVIQTFIQGHGVSPWPLQLEPVCCQPRYQCESARAAGREHRCKAFF